MKTIKSLFFFSKAKLFLLLIVKSLRAALEAGFALIYYYFFDFLGKRGRKEFVFFGLFVLLYTIVFSIFFALNRYRTKSYRTQRTYLYRKTIFSRILSLDYQDLESMTADEYIAIFEKDINSISDDLFQQTFDVISYFLSLCFSLIIAFVLNYLIALITFSLALIEIVIPLRFNKRLEREYHEVSQSHWAFSKVAGNFLASADVIQNTASRKNVEKVADRKNQAVSFEERKYYATCTKANLLNNFITNFLQISVLFVSGILFYYGKSDIPTTAAFLQIGTGIYVPVSQIFSSMTFILGTKKVVKRIEAIQPKPKKETKEEYLYSFHSFRLKNLCLRFSGKTLLRDFSYTFRQGKKYILTGQSGCGKTTLLETLIGHNSLYEGSIFYDSKEGREVSEESKNTSIAYCKQEPVLFLGSLKNNITRFADKIDKERLDSVISQCQLNDFAKRRGRDSLLDNQDNRISLGEKQRISLARALYQNKPVLFLDKITSSLDTENKEKIYQTIKGIENRLVIWITHDERAKSFEWVDEVIDLSRMNNHLEKGQ